MEPLPGDSAFEQWKDAMKAVARLPLGIPDEFRKKVIEIFKTSESDKLRECLNYRLLPIPMAQQEGA